MKHLAKESLLAKVLAGLGLGVIAGLVLGQVPDPYFKPLTQWVAFPGYLFLALIQMVVLPLILSSVFYGIAGSATIDLVKRLGVRLVAYFTLTTCMAISIGLTWVYLLKPGKLVNSNTAQALIEKGGSFTPPTAPAGVENMPKALAGLLPTNIFDALGQGALLQVVLFASVMGTAVLLMPKQKAEPLISLARSIQDLSMVVVGWAMSLAPYAVFGLLAQVVARTGTETLAAVGVYMITVLLGLATVVVGYGLLIALFSNQKVGHFFKAARPLQLLAFSTSSSAAVMPVTLETAEHELKINPAIAGIVVPTGATINMDGTALYQAIAAVFIAQVFGIDLSWGQLLTLLGTTLAASIGTPGTPGVGIVVLSGILLNLGVPPSGIALIIGVDRLLDMCRTTINVTGDLTACAVMDRLLAPKKSRHLQQT